MRSRARGGLSACPATPYGASIWVGGGGAEGSRTPDLLIANEALYQLSYGPPEGGRK